MIFDNDEDSYFDEHEMMNIRHGKGLNKRHKIHKELYMHNGDGILDVFDDIGTWLLNTGNDVVNWVGGNKDVIKGVIDAAKAVNGLGGELKEMKLDDKKGDGMILDENIKPKRGRGVNKKIFTDIVKKVDKIAT